MLARATSSHSAPPLQSYQPAPSARHVGSNAEVVVSIIQAHCP